jgi:leucyl-tRNA synthetase
MEYNNYLVEAKETAVYGGAAWEEAMRSLIPIIAPIMPHLAEELWERLGGAYSVHTQRWPQYDAGLAADEVITLVVQLNAKVRARLEVPVDVTEAGAKELALSNASIQQYLAGKQVLKVIYVPGRLLNIVVR